MIAKEVSAALLALCPGLLTPTLIAWTALLTQDDLDTTNVTLHQNPWRQMLHRCFLFVSVLAWPLRLKVSTVDRVLHTNHQSTVYDYYNTLSLPPFLSSSRTLFSSLLSLLSSFPLPFFSSSPHWEGKFTRVACTISQEVATVFTSWNENTLRNMAADFKVVPPGKQKG